MSKHNAFREFSNNNIFIAMSVSEYDDRWQRLSIPDRRKRHKLVSKIKRVAKDILTIKQWESVRLVYFTKRIRKTYIRDIARRRGIRYSVFKKRLRNAQERMKRYFKSNDQLIDKWRSEINKREE